MWLLINDKLLGGAEGCKVHKLRAEMRASLKPAPAGRVRGPRGVAADEGECSIAKIRKTSSRLYTDLRLGCRYCAKVKIEPTDEMAGRSSCGRSNTGV
jgi:hypothetical protein